MDIPRTFLKIINKRLKFEKNYIYKPSRLNLIIPASVKTILQYCISISSYVEPQVLHDCAQLNNKVGFAVHSPFSAHPEHSLNKKGINRYL